MYYCDLKIKYNESANEGFILKNSIYAYNKYLRNPKSPIEHQNRTNEEIILELHRFDKFLLVAYSQLKEISNIETKHIEEYKIFCKEGLCNTNITINKKIRAIRHFFDFLRNVKKIIKYNIALEVSYLPTDEAEHPLHIPKSNLRILLDLMSSYTNGVRDVCITKLLAYLGLRLNEIFKLSTNSINLKTKELYIKREKKYITYRIPDILYTDLKNYMFLRNELSNINSDNSLFLSNTGNPYPMREYQRKFKSAVIDADFKKTFTPRNVRATFAYHMAQNIKEDKLQLLLNQDKVEHYYNIDELIIE